METELNVLEERIIGCLIEKEMATPEYYPLTLNALVNACNQKSNRYPAMALEEATVEGALYTLRTTHQLAVEVSVSGSRVAKYRHNMGAHWNFSPAEIAILCELFIRGPQTPGDLRAHASRLHPLADAAEVEIILQGLAQHEDGPFVLQLPREPGKRENRWAHLFSGEPKILDEQEQVPLKIETVSRDNERIDELENEIAKLRGDLDDLKSAFETFKASFD
ncbi:MAG: YceH family protein [Pontiellaceae bacterium]|nr:YceH family protein [Pontiellaceae bacterium]MBN2784246.1 YceH family protein [Pontiellaceae bacterium]